jgi:tetratricopeptide (TPR) repeat protein
MNRRPGHVLARRLSGAFWLVIPGLVAVVLGGCTEGTRPAWFSKNKNAAEKRWNRMRSNVRMELARAELDEGRYGEAAAQLATAESQTSDLPGLNLLKAKVLIAKGDFYAAEPMLRKALEADSRSAEAHYLLGTVLQQSSRLAEAIEHYRTATTLEPVNNEYALAVAECCLSVGDARAALEWLEQLRRAPGGLESKPEYFVLLGEAHRMLGDTGRAAVAYENAINLGADDDHTRTVAGELYITLKDYRRAMELIEPVVDRQEQPSPSLVMSLARCLLETGRPREARTRLGVLVREHDDPWSWLMLGQASARCGDPRAAISNVKRAIELDRDSPVAQQMLAGLALQAEDYSLAVSAAERAARLDPTDALNYCLLAEAFHRRGDRRRAARLYRDALELDPECQTARAALLVLNPELAAADP